MTDKTISQLTRATLPGTDDLLPIVQSANTRAITVGNLFAEFDTYAALLAATPPSTTRNAFLRGYYAAGDGGGGPLYYDTTSTATHNAGTVIKPTAVSGAGRWLRVGDANVINVLEFGVTGDGTTNDRASLTAADGAGGSLLIVPAGATVRVSSNLTVATPTLFQAGAAISADTGVTVTFTGAVISPYGDHRAGLGTVTVSGHLQFVNGNNIVSGVGAGDDISSGTDNILIGELAGRFLTTGSDNILIGEETLINVAAAASSQNVCIGSLTGRAITTASQQVLIGYSTGTAITQGMNNTFVGHECGKQTTTGGSNAFYARAAGNDNTTGGFNTYVGHAAGFDYTTGGQNTFIGNQAGNPVIAGTPARTGSDNTGVGEFAGPTLETADNTCCFGHDATVQASNMGKFGAALTDSNISGRLFRKTTRQTNATAGGVTYSVADFLGPLLLRTGTGGPYTDNTPAATDIVAAIPGCEVGSGYFLYIKNTSGGTLTLGAGAGVTLSGTTTVANGSTRLYNVEVTATGTPAVLVTGVMTATA